MADDYKDMLQQVLKALPTGQRVRFLREVLQSLNKDDKESVLKMAAAPEPSGKVPTSPSTAVEPPKLRQEAKPVSRPAEAKSLKKASDPIPEKRAVKRRPKPNTDTEALVEAEFKKLVASKDREQPMSRQLLNCCGLALVVLAGLIGLVLASESLVDWIWDLVQRSN